MERDALGLKNSPEVEIVGFGQFKNVLFRTDDRNVDLFDNFIVFQPFINDQFWITVKVSEDDVNVWDEDDIASVELFIEDDFGYDGYNTHLEIIFGEGFPRSVPALWYFTVSERLEENDAPNP